MHVQGSPQEAHSGETRPRIFCCMSSTAVSLCVCHCASSSDASETSPYLLYALSDRIPPRPPRKAKSSDRISVPVPACSNRLFESAAQRENRVIRHAFETNLLLVVRASVNQIASCSTSPMTGGFQAWSGMGMPHIIGHERGLEGGGAYGDRYLYVTHESYRDGVPVYGLRRYHFLVQQREITLGRPKLGVLRGSSTAVVVEQRRTSKPPRPPTRRHPCLVKLWLNRCKKNTDLPQARRDDGFQGTHSCALKNGGTALPFYVLSRPCCA